MNARYRMVFAAAALAAACWCGAQDCHGEQGSPLIISPSNLTAGNGFFFDVKLNAPISAPFDVYCFANTTYGVFSLRFDGYVYYGPNPVYTSVWGYEFPYAHRVRPRVTIPTDMRFNFITFYLFITPAGQAPPFTFLEELGPNTANIVMFDSVTLPVR
jgi:hypothetical protein